MTRIGCLILAFASVISCQKSVVYERKIKPEWIIDASDDRLKDDRIELSADTVYILATNLVRNAGQQLHINAGTIVKVRDKISITINPGASIESKGTAVAPVIFTSAAAPGGAGVTGDDGSGIHFWYGIRIYGNALNQPASGSGTITYTRIEFAGGDEGFLGIPALLFSQVGSETVLHHIQVSYSFETASIGFRGGIVNASYLLSYSGGSNDFQIEEGYKGKLQFLHAVRHPYFPVPIVGPNLAGLLITGDQTEPVISNLSVTGPGSGSGVSLSYTQRDPSAAVVVTGGARFHLRNSVLAAFPMGGLAIFNRQSAGYLNHDESEFNYSYVHSVDSLRSFYLPNGIYPPFTSKDFREFMLESRHSNIWVKELAEFSYKSLFDYNALFNYPGDQSPLIAGAVFDGNFFADPFFTRVNFVGATDQQPWWKGWSNINPLTTKYNQ